MHTACDRLNHLTESLNAYGKIISIKCMLHFHATLESKDSNRDTGNKQSLFNHKIENTHYSTIKFNEVNHYLFVKKSLIDSSKMLSTLEDFCFLNDFPEIIWTYDLTRNVQHCVI